MKIIVLSGPPNSGKTSTLNFLFYHLNIENDAIIESKSQLVANPFDFECLIKYQNKKVGVFSMGDYSRVLVQQIEIYLNKKCVIFICACNVNFVLPYRKIAKFENASIKKSIALSKLKSDYEILNNSDSMEIMSEIQNS